MIRHFLIDFWWQVASSGSKPSFYALHHDMVLTKHICSCSLVVYVCTQYNHFQDTGSEICTCSVRACLLQCLCRSISSLSHSSVRLKVNPNMPNDLSCEALCRYTFITHQFSSADDVVLWTEMSDLLGFSCRIRAT